MRVRSGGIGRVVAVGCAVAGVVLVAASLLSDRHDAPPTTASSVSAAAGVPTGRPQLEQETRKLLGSFRLAKGRAIRISTAETVDGMGCLIEEGDGFASSCLEHGLFSSRRAELIVSSTGGPDRYDELRVSGAVAPSVDSVLVVKTDGTTVELPLTPQRAFAYESPAIDLESGVLPTALQLFGRGGRLLETVDFPAGN